MSKRGGKKGIPSNDPEDKAQSGTPLPQIWIGVIPIVQFVGVPQSPPPPFGWGGVAVLMSRLTAAKVLIEMIFAPT
jgi:hypothetical protein